MMLQDSDMKRRAEFFCVALIVITVNGCASRKQETAAGVISANLSISSYARARQQATSTKESSFDFPVLEIYNSSGILVYSGHESIANAQTLREFPASISNFKPQERAPHLLDILEAIPDFKRKERQIMQGKKWIIISTELEGCEACAVQDDALLDAKSHLLGQQSVNLLEIHVSHP